MDKNTIKLAIIGCGYWGPNFVRNFSSIKNSSVKYACDLDTGKLAHLKTLYPKLITTNNYLQALNDKEINAVVISTSAQSHYKLAKAALLSNKHVLVEKPFTVKISEGKELIETAKEKKRILMVGHTFKFNPSVTKLKALIKTGALGKIYYIYSRRTNLGPLRKDVNVVWDLAPHDISIVNYLIGDMPLFAQAHGEKYLPHNQEDVAFITLGFSGNLLAHIHVSWLDPKKTREIVVVGSKKMAVFNDLDTETPLVVYDKSVISKKFKQEYDTFGEFQMIIKNGTAKALKIKKEEPLKVECRHFIECIRKNREPMTNGKDGLEVLTVLLAVQSSLSQKNCKVALKGIKKNIL